MTNDKLLCTWLQAIAQKLEEGELCLESMELTTPGADHWGDSVTCLKISYSEPEQMIDEDDVLTDPYIKVA